MSRPSTRISTTCGRASSAGSCAAGTLYLDYTGSGLYAESQVRAHLELLSSGVLGNPHADHAASRVSTATVEGARLRVLRFLDADPADYTVCFTPNASGALKLVAESYPFGRDTALVLSSDNHNSVHGLREYAARAGARVRYVMLGREMRLVDAEPILDAESSFERKLFAFPAQSNFSGVQHPFSLVSARPARGYDVLLDIAAWVPTRPFSLSRCPADFVAFSFYKIFGYPTGVGALVARREALARLARPWFAGGTVAYASVHANRHLLRGGAESFEDGTPNFLAIAGLDTGFDLVDEVGLPRLSTHVSRLTEGLLEDLAALRHAGGEPVVELYGPRSMNDRGATLAFNVLDRQGHPVPFWDVEARGRAARVSMRGGCFCNPGASEAAFGYEPSEVIRCLDEVTEGFTLDRFKKCIGPKLAVGAVRASLGMASSQDDVRRAVDVVASFADTKPVGIAV